MDGRIILLQQRVILSSANSLKHMHTYTHYMQESSSSRKYMMYSLSSKSQCSLFHLPEEILFKICEYGGYISEQLSLEYIAEEIMATRPYINLRMELMMVNLLSRTQHLQNDLEVIIGTWSEDISLSGNDTTLIECHELISSTDELPSLDVFKVELIPVGIVINEKYLVSLTVGIPCYYVEAALNSMYVSVEDILLSGDCSYLRCEFFRDMLTISRYENNVQSTTEALRDIREIHPEYDISDLLMRCKNARIPGHIYSMLIRSL